MCALCGVLGGSDHWTAAAGRPDTFGATRTRRAERLEHVRVVNRILRTYAMRVDDWEGTSFVLSGPTGARAVVDALPAVWQAATELRGGPIDPLDLQLLQRLRSAK